MPVTFDAPEVLGTPLQIEPPVEQDPTLGETVEAAFETQNSVASLLARGPSRDYELTPLSPELDLAEPAFDPLSDDALAGYEPYADSFVGVQTQAEAEAVKREIDREVANRETLAASGALGVVSEIAAGTLDPLFLPALMVPGVNGARVAGTAGRFALAGGAGAAVTEVALQATQETRTGLESAFNITGATLLSGLLGGASAALTRKDFESLAKAVDDEFAEALPNQNMGAAVVADTNLADETLVNTGGVARAIKGGSPLTRTLQSPSLKTRQVIQDLAESPLYTMKNAEGKASNAAVETLIKAEDARVGQSLEQLDALYVQYRTGKPGSRAALGVKDLFGARRRSGQLNFRAFREEVGKALRRNDTHDIPEVQAAAQAFRKHLFEPHKVRAQQLGLLPENLSVTGAPSYLTRVYNIERINAERPRFRTILSAWLQREGIQDTADADDMAEQIIDNILGTPSGIIPREIVPKAGPLKSRELTIQDAAIEDFLESDIELVARFYNRTLAPELALVERFGEKDMKGAIGQVANDYEALIDQATNQKARAKLAKQRDADIRDIEAVRDRLVGTYGQPADPSYWAVRAGRLAREINYLRLLGGMTISAIPDIARPVMAHGLRRYTKALVQLATAPGRFKLAGKEVKRAGTAWDMVLNSRATSLADIGDLYGRGSRVERGVQALSDSFGIPSLMAPWNAAMKQFTGVMTATRMLEESLKAAAGKATKASLRKLAQQNIDDAMAARISTQFEQFGDRGDVWLAQTHLWQDQGAARAFNAALVKEVDTLIVTPGAADRPLWMSTETGKLVGQFKSFAFAASNRVLLSGLQQRDAAVLNGTLLSVALGSVAYGLKQTVAGREISDEPDVLLAESLDRSGLFGYLFDVNNIVEKATRGTVGVSALTGGPQMSRYASRNVLGALLGPSAGVVGDVSQVVGAISTGDVQASDVHAVRKLLPYQNLFYLRQLLNEAEKGAAEAIGVD